jgi:Dienelactone hydrolase and related enzymes
MRLVFLLTLFIISGLFSAKAQVKDRLEGDWHGKINAGIELRLVFHISKDSTGTFTTTFDSPDQSAFGIPTNKTTVGGDSVFIEMKNIGASFAGRLKSDSILTGTFTQKIKFPLQLKKGEEIENKKPQTPQAPFPYKSEDVIYKNADKSIQFGATITMPNGKGPFPAAILVTGSGAQNRDEEIMGHKIFAVLADHLTRKGFVVLRVDDRGVGKTTGDFSSATSMDFANDLDESIGYLKSRSEVDKNKIGLIGHSEGGMIAPMVATKRNDIDFIVLLAAPGIKIKDLMTEQNAAILLSSGISSNATKAYTTFYDKLLTTIINSPDSVSAKDNTTRLVKEWIQQTDTTIIKELGWADENTRTEIVNSIVSAFASPWFTYFLKFDPQLYLEKIQSKVLALNGSKDLQVNPTSNLAAIKNALAKSKSPLYEVKEMPGLNHLFQTCSTCTLNEYGELSETFSPMALNFISDWLIKNVK